MDLWIVRHADATPTAAGGRDIDRPLSARGIADCARLGAHIERLGARADLILASHARRTRTTAELLAPSFGQPADAVVLDARIYDADAQTLLELLQETAPEVGHVALIGHNPGVSALVAHLAKREWRGGLPPLGMVCASIEATWPNIGHRCAAVQRYLDPTTLD